MKWIGWKRAISDLRNSRLTIDSAGVYHFLHFTNFPQFPGCPSLLWIYKKNYMHTIIRYCIKVTHFMWRDQQHETHESFVYKIYVKFPVTSVLSKIKQSEIIELNETR